MKIWTRDPYNLMNQYSQEFTSSTFFLQGFTRLYKNDGHISAWGIANPYPTYIIMHNHTSICIYELWNMHGRYLKYRNRCQSLQYHALQKDEERRESSH
jgi:hypothetical protein